MLGVYLSISLQKFSFVPKTKSLFLFFLSKETCYRCVFIMQKHFNVLQYRASMFEIKSHVDSFILLKKF
jgi:hypothetical protein